MKRLTLLLMLMLPVSLLAQELTAKEIIEKADAIMKGVTSTKAEMTITTVRPKWTREMKMKTWSKGTDLSMILITSPVKDKGTAFLMRKKEVWNWMPSIERTVKLPPSMMMQNWMGTDFTNDDLVKQSSVVVDYTHKIVGEEKIEGRLCYKIELTPKEDAPVVWGKIYSWVDKTDYFQMKVEFYDEDDYLINVMKASDVKVLGGKKMPTKMEMIPMEKKGHSTVMTYTNMEFDVEIDDSFFSVQNMKRLK